MRKAALILNAIAVLLSAVFLGYTFFARQHLDSLAREFVTAKTVHYSGPVVDFAHKAMKKPAVRLLLTADQETAIEGEIAEYRRDPAAYVADLTRRIPKPIAKAGKRPHPLLAKVLAIKDAIRKFYDDTLNALIVDLRIFAGSNLCAATIAVAISWRSSERNPALLGFSILIFIAVAYCSYLYIDGLSFFSILFRLHMGWWYPVTLCVVVIGLAWNAGVIPIPAESNTTASNREATK